MESEVLRIVMQDVLLVLLGVVSGTLSSLFGIGGGIIVVPVLSNLMLPLKEAIVVSVIQMVFTSVFGTVINAKNGLIGMKYCTFLSLGGVVGGLSSGLVLRWIPAIYLLESFCLVSCVLLLAFVYMTGSNVAATPAHSDQYRFLVMFLGGIFTGLFCITLGVGGGLITSFLTKYLLGYDSKRSVPVSLFFIAFASVSGVISFGYAGVMNVDLLVTGAMIGLSSMFGCFAGTIMLKVMRPVTHRSFVIVVYGVSILVTLNKILLYYGYGIVI